MHPLQHKGGTTKKMITESIIAVQQANATQSRTIEMNGQTFDLEAEQCFSKHVTITWNRWNN